MQKTRQVRQAFQGSGPAFACRAARAPEAIDERR